MEINITKGRDIECYHANLRIVSWWSLLVVVLVVVVHPVFSCCDQQWFSDFRTAVDGSENTSITHENQLYRQEANSWFSQLYASTTGTEAVCVY